MPITAKSDAPDALTIWRKEVELEASTNGDTGASNSPKSGREACQIKEVRSDNAPELKKVLNQWHRNHGTKIGYTAVHSSYQNGIAERHIQTTEAGIRAMLKDAELPIEFWDEASMAISYLRNRTSSGPEVKGQTYRMTPEEAWTGRKPEIGHLRVWRCKCFAYVHQGDLRKDDRHDKLRDRGRVGIFVGYEKTPSQWRVFIPDLGRTIRSASIRWSENVKGGSIALKKAKPERDERPKGALVRSEIIFSSCIFPTGYEPVCVRLHEKDFVPACDRALSKEP